jgi:hypothetical protein
MSDERSYWVYSPDKIRLSREARAWAHHWDLTDKQFAKFLLTQHLERGDPFAHDTGPAAGRDKIRGFEPEALDPFAGDVGVPAGRDDIVGFAPGTLDPFLGDVGTPAGRDDIEGFQALADALPDAFENLGPPPDRKRSRSEFPFE